MRNFILFISGNHVIANSEGEKKNEERKEERKVKEKK